MLVFAFDKRVSYTGIPDQPICGAVTDKPWIPVCVAEWQLECFSDVAKLMPTKMVTKLHIPFIYPVAFRSHVGGAWFTMNDFDEVISAFDWIDPTVINAMRDSRAMLVLDDKSEGHPIIEDYLFKYLHMLSARLQVPPPSIVYITSNLLAERRYEAWAKNVPKQLQVRVISDNWFAPDTFRNLKRKTRAFDASKIEKTFLCFNRHFNNFREHFVRDLMNEELVNKGYVSLCSATAEEVEVLSNPDTYFDWASRALDRENYARGALEFVKRLPLTVDTNNFSHNHVRTVTPEFYNKTLLSLITETWVHNDTIFITEKTYKAMQLLHPFIILGNPGTLTELRKQGFRTFAPLINEEYDNEPILEKRKNLILKELHRLSSMTIEQQQLLAVELHEIAKHNKTILQTLGHSYGRPILEHFEYVTGKNFHRGRETKGLQ